MTSFALVGLGKMGANMARRLAQGGVRAAVYDRDTALTHALAEEIGSPVRGVDAETLTRLIAAVEAPRVVWLMLPAGEATETAIAQVGHGKSMEKGARLDLLF